MSRVTPDGVLLINFGEPETPDPEAVRDFLERIFTANARLDSPADHRAARARSRELARARTPGLVRDYERIGGSPLHRQARAQQAALAAELERRGRRLPVELGMQFTDPSVPDAVSGFVRRGVERVVALPVYPLCGPSTTVAGLEEARLAGAALEPPIELLEVSGWHTHTGYVDLRANAIRRSAERAGLDLADPAVHVVFSAHGTPLRYLDEGSRYVRYVEEWCRLVAARLGIEGYVLGYQNHANRDIAWTAPSIDDALGGLASGDDIIVDAVSFVHEQSETLVELDEDLRERAGELGLRFHRVPVPFDDPGFAVVLADLVEAALGRPPAGLPPLAACACRPGAAVCLNGDAAPSAAVAP